MNGQTKLVYWVLGGLLSLNLLLAGFVWQSQVARLDRIETALSVIQILPSINAQRLTDIERRLGAIEGLLR